MKTNTFIKTTLAVAIFSSLIGAPAIAATITQSQVSGAIKGFTPYIPSVGAEVYVYDSATATLSSQPSSTEHAIKIHDKVIVPLEIEEAAYNKFYSFLDLDKDAENKEAIKTKIEWYLLKPTSDIDAINSQQLPPVEIGNEYTVGFDAVSKQIGFRIQAISETGVPIEGLVLDVPNIAYFGGQTIPGCDPADIATCDASIDPENNTPNTDKNPTIVDNGGDNGKGVEGLGQYVVDVLKADGSVLGTNNAYVNTTYTARVMELVDDGNGGQTYEDKTDELVNNITWSISNADSTEGARFMTSKGYMNVPTEPSALAAFDPADADYTADSSVSARFGEDIKTFKTQVDNNGSIEALKSLAPNFSDQGLQLSIEFIAPNKTN